jgi:copper(I)-binding protein
MRSRTPALADGDAVRRVLVAIACSLAFQLVVAQEYQLQSLRIDHPFARATPPGARSAGAYFGVKNDAATPDRLVSVSSPVAGIAEVHEMTMDGGMMRMHAVSGIEIKAGARVELKPGGYHVMLMDLKRALRKGERFPMTLSFEKAGRIDVSVSVEDMGATSGDGLKH